MIKDEFDLQFLPFMQKGMHFLKSNALLVI